MKITDVELEYQQKVAKHRQDCLFYGGEVVRFKVDDNKYLTIGAYGNVRCNVYNNEGVRTDYIVDKNNDGLISKKLPGVKNDEMLFELISNGRLEFTETNSWEVSGIVIKDGKEHIVVLDTEYSILENAYLEPAIEEVTMGGNLDFWVNELNDAIERDGVELK